MAFRDPFLQAAYARHIEGKDEPTREDWHAFEAAERKWLEGKTIASVDMRGELAIIVFTDGTRASFEGNVRSDLCTDCYFDVECEPLLFVAEDVDCREAIHGRVSL